ncbi:hypothetical protein BH11PAT1_BH11PAT1_0390 [soil metagenome]
MNSKTGVIIVFLAIVILGGTLVLMNQKTPAPKTITNTTAVVTPTPQLPAETAITLSEKDGFSPKTITIKVGNAIRWTNSDGEKATINSDDHPTHRKFPEMNLGEFRRGESLTHIFNKPGTYTYHDHYNQTSKGRIIVE